MHASSERFRSDDQAGEALLHAAAEPRSRAGAWGAAALGFFGFLPYVAVNVGNASAVQLGAVLAALMALPVLMVPWRGRPYWVYPVLVAPLCLSTLKVAVADDGDLGLCFKTLLVWATSCLVLLPVQHHGPRYAVDLLTGIAAAAVLHVAVGLWQWYSFTLGQFPFPELYGNRSFLSVQENAQTIARYIRRPFGMFPEPSAMTASLAPFVLFWMAELCGLVRLRHAPARWQRALFAAAAVGGLGLMVLSKSGHAAVALAAAAVFVAAWFTRARASAGSYLAVAVVLGVVVPAVLWFASASLAERVGGAKSSLGNSSWEERTDSLRIGFSLLAGGNVPTALFGMGCGLSSPALWAAARLESVWSVSLSYVYETGLVGLVAVALVGRLLLGTWTAGGRGVAFPTIAAAWVVGVTLTTSYQQLLPLWIALGWLTIWPQVCVTVARHRQAPLVSWRPPDTYGVDPPAASPPSGARRPRGWRLDPTPEALALVATATAAATPPAPDEEPTPATTAAVRRGGWGSKEDCPTLTRSE